MFIILGSLRIFLAKTCLLLGCRKGVIMGIYSAILDGVGSRQGPGRDGQGQVQLCDVELQTKVKRRLAKISQSQSWH